MRLRYRHLQLKGPLAWAAVLIALSLGLLLAVWMLATAILLALLLPLLASGYGAFLRFRRRRWRRLPPR